VEQGKAYRCYCTPERLKAVNEEKKARKETLGYDRHCRNLTPEERATHEGEPHVIRFAMPLEGQTVVQDRVRGEIVFKHENPNDAVLLKSDGFPTYHLAVVVDDHFMKISHAMRSDEWIPSLGLHQNLYQAFGWDAPEWVHLPVILSPTGGKMSKRNPPKDEKGNPIPIMVHEYRELGYLPDALVNFLTNIGYNFGDDREIFSIEETIRRFDLDRINNTGAKFPMKKLVWLNGEYIREKLSDEELVRHLRAPLERAGLTVDTETLLKIVPILRVRLKTLNDVVDMAGFFFHEQFQPPTSEMLVPKKMDTTGAREMLQAAHAVLKDMDDFSAEVTHSAMAGLVQQLGLKNGQVFGGLRIAVTGQTVSPPTFETMEILGKNLSLERIQLAIDILGE
jgi:glutamyl-tRNA synthetase